jgi:L-threonate 2-dehydrogenase
MSDVIAIIAPGEMGAAIGQRLGERGARVVTSLAGRSAASAKRAERAGLVPVASDDDLVAEADFVLSVVPPGDAAGLAERLAPVLARAKQKPVYVDCNAVAPDTAERISAILGATGCAYVDGGIIGPPPSATATAHTKLYVSGDGAGEVMRLAAYGLDVRVVDGPVGAASALKMSYAGLTKGFTALGVAMMLGAERAGCEEALRRELAESQPQFLAWLSRQVPRMYPKAYRWVAEMEEIANFLDGDDSGPDIYRAMARLYDRLADVQAGERRSGDAIDKLTRFCTAGAQAGAARKTA